MSVPRILLALFGGMSSDIQKRVRAMYSSLVAPSTREWAIMEPLPRVMTPELCLGRSHSLFVTPLLETY